MSWEDQKSIKRIFNTFNRLKNQIWQQDIDALKQLNTATQNASKSYVNDNLLYAKLLAMQLRQEVSHFGNAKEAIVNVGRGLNKPLEYHIEMLRLELNNADDMNYFKELGLEFDRDTKENRDKKMQTLEANQKEVIEKVQKFHNYDKVQQSFYNTANDFLKETDNYI